MFIEIAVNIPTDKTFIYSVPESLEKDIALGKRVLIPLEKRRMSGYIVGLTSSPSVKNTKDIIDVLDAEPLFNADDLIFYRWVSRYYIYPLGKALSEILPGGIDLKSDRWMMPTKAITEGSRSDMPPALGRIIDILVDFPKGMPLSQLKKSLNKNSISKEIERLRAMGLAYTEDRVERPKIGLKKEKVVALEPGFNAPAKPTKNQQRFIDYLEVNGPSSFATLRQSFKNVPSMVRVLQQKGFLHVTEEEIYRKPPKAASIGKDHGDITLNEDQEVALREIEKGLQSRRFSPYLLHGVTGSGKTEVYMSAIEETLRLKGGAIFLVPEIALTPQLITRLNRKFDERNIAVLHSGIPQSARYDQWRHICRGDISIVVGARSALYAPVKNLKLIIIDEEHDTSYKQDDRMRYNARDMALMRAKLLSATVVIGSATPAVQTYFNAVKGKYAYLILPARVEDRPLPSVEIVDMKLEPGRQDKVHSPMLSRRLQGAIEETLGRNEQAILFLNRRGFHTFVFCPDCGYTFNCTHCAISMTHHAGEGLLKCHHCDYSITMPSHCPQCKSKRIMQHGAGTERLEDEVKKRFPHARVGRVDSDTTASKGSLEKIFQALDRHDIDILVGTQIITKGHDFHDITLVGIISADASLNFPDFRATERTFQLLVQAAGRGGRGNSPGRVIIQTFNPDHHAIQAAKHHDYPGFYSEELETRRLFGYPPYSRLVSLHLSSARKDLGAKGIEKMKELVKHLMKTANREGKLEIIGPTESPISRLKGRYRWQLILKGENTPELNRVVHDILSNTSGIGLDIKVDVDPMNFI